MQHIAVQKTNAPKTKPAIDRLPFGEHFTDHMFLMDYTRGTGWANPRIVPYGPFQLDPGAAVFHYGQEIFEGLKAYRRPDGGVQLFRYRDNIRRMNQSAERMCIPEVPEDIVAEGLLALISLERDWVPSNADSSLYIRPFIFATDPRIKVAASDTYTFCIITSPAGSYFPEGLNPVNILIEERDVRAVRGGTGYAKCGGNYAASLRSARLAAKSGFSQVMWLDAIHRKYIEEVGAMNVMFKIDGKVITPALTDTVLDGITRKSVIKLLDSWGTKADERLISVDELVAAAKAGVLEEAWGTGTAATIAPIGRLCYAGETFVVGDGKTGALTRKIYDNLTGIQCGTLADPFGWTEQIC